MLPSELAPGKGNSISARFAFPHTPTHTQAGGKRINRRGIERASAAPALRQSFARHECERVTLPGPGKFSKIR